MSHREGSAGTPPWEQAQLRIFLNYRRDDSRPYARLVHGALRARWSGKDQVFWDVDRIDPGVPFAEAIYRAVGRTDVLISLIGPTWASAADAEGRRRLDNPQDYVRVEIEAALARDVPVIPAMVAGALPVERAELPESLASLAGLNTIELTDGHWEHDIDRLIRRLEDIEADKIDRIAELSRPERPSVRSRSTDHDVTPDQSLAAGRRRGERSDNGSSDHRSRLVVVVLAAALGILAAAGSYLVFRADGDQNGPAPRGGATADAIESELLLAHVPEDFVESCRSAVNNNPDVFVREVVCAPERGITVRYGRAHGGDGLRNYFLEQVGIAQLPFPTRETCRSSGTAAGEWVRVEIVGHKEERSRQAQGRILCYRVAGQERIAWTDTPTKIYAVASAARADRRQLYEWWTQEAGPSRHIGHTGHRLGPFPDSIEQELILNHAVPRDERDECTRTASRDATVFLRTIVCRQGETDLEVEYSYAHSGTAIRTYFDNLVTGVGIESSELHQCRDQTAAAGFWTGAGTQKQETPRRNSRGRILCYVRGNEAVLEWTDVRNLIFAHAVRSGSEQRELYSWWAKKSGPVETGDPGSRGSAGEHSGSHDG